MLLELGKRQRHQLPDAFHTIDALLAIQQDNHLLLEACLRLNDDLTAGAAGRHGLFRQHAVSTTGGNGQNLDRLLRKLCSGGKQRRPLGTESGGEGRILLVTAHKLAAVVQYDTGSHVEVTVRSVTTVGALDGQLNGFLLFGAEFLYRANLYSRLENPIDSRCKDTIFFVMCCNISNIFA